jgi:hypothetical protein
MATAEMKPLPPVNVSKWRQRLNEADHGPKIFVDEVEETDVLLGKQRDAFNHVGNRNFRDLIHENWERYNNSKGRCERTAIVVQIVRFLREERQVRFLKKDAAVDKWFIVHDSVAREKVGHAIRDAINFRRHHDRKVEEARQQGIDVTELEQQGRISGRPLTNKNGRLNRPIKPGPPKKRKKKNTSKNGEISSRENIAEILGLLKRSGTNTEPQPKALQPKSKNSRGFGNEPLPKALQPKSKGSRGFGNEPLLKALQPKSKGSHGFGNIPKNNDFHNRPPYGTTPIRPPPVPSTQNPGIQEAAMMGAFNVWASQSFC